MQVVAQWHANTLAPWIPQRHRTIHTSCGVEHMAQFFLVFRSHELYIGNWTQKRDIKDTMLCWPIFTNNTCSIHCKDNMQILHTDVMYNLIKCSLQERRVDRDNWQHTTYSQTTRKSDRMLLRNANIKVAI